MKFLIQICLVLVGVAFLGSCNYFDENHEEIIGIWESSFIDSPDLGLIKHTILFEKNGKFEFHIELDTGGTLSFSGKFNLREDLLLLHSKLGYGLQDGKKVHPEKIDISQKYQILKLDTDVLVLRILEYDTDNDTVKFKKIKKSKKILLK